MKKYIKSIVLGMSLVGLTACNDYLDKTPETGQIPETFFTTAANLSAFTQNFYGWFTTHSNYAYNCGTFAIDNGTDNQASAGYSARWTPGNWLVSEGTDNWSFTQIRQTNYFFNYAQPEYDNGNITGNQSLINEAMGEAHFFRAFAYWNQYSNVGDYPILEGLLPSSDEALLLEQSKRQPRNKVARYILDDLAQAITLLPETSSKGKNGLNKDCARLFRSRVALFEGTWLKNHKGTALVPGGPGWPGNSGDLGDFNIDTEISYFLTEAMTSAKEVADKYVGNLVENTDAEVPVSASLASQNPYFTMFGEQNLDKYSEVLLYKYYDKTQGVSTQIQHYYQTGSCGSGWTRGLVNSFVMKNGLPIYAAGSGYDPAWENAGVTATLKDRDSRIRIFTGCDTIIKTYSGGKPGRWDMAALFTDASTRCTTGFGILKGDSFNGAEVEMNLNATTGSIIFRAVESLLNYMEACVEKNGNIDGTADGYWRAIRRRAHVDEDWNKTVNATQMAEEAKGDWGAYSHGQYVSNLLYNVRRERRNELIGESLRLMDLRRWRALDQMETTPYIIEGMKYWGTCYNDPSSPLAITRKNANTGKLEFIEPVVSPGTGDGTMSPEANSPYIRPYQISNVSGQNLVWDGYRFCEAHYLSPIGMKAFTNASPDGALDNSVIYQNPGWPKEANKGAIGY